MQFQVSSEELFKRSVRHRSTEKDMRVLGFVQFKIPKATRGEGFIMKITK
jgi:hypothetical protein